MMGQLYTIGHSNIQIENFIELLKKYEINYLLDVRSVPYAKYATQYNNEQLNSSLSVENINYVFMGKYFGARQNDIELYSDEGYLDFEKTSHSYLFVKGMENVKLGLKKGNNIVLMCSEKNPIDCHRAIMVARAFSLDGIDVKHILLDGNLKTQEELDRELVSIYFREKKEVQMSLDLSMEEKEVQLPLIDDLSMEEKIQKAYRKQNKKIGYYLD